MSEGPEEIPNNHNEEDEGIHNDNPEASEDPNDSNPVQDEAPPSSSSAGETTTTAPTRSNLHTRLLNQQRSNLLLQVLFHHMLNSRRRREEEEALALSPPPLPDREMPILSHNEALESNAICRFCFEGSVAPNNNNSNSTATTRNNSLVAPCNCAGGSRWVHLDCLRQWQRLQARSPDMDGETTTYTPAGYICNVCNSPYLSRPPTIRSVRRNILKRGTLLVSKPNHVGRTFQQTVVLLLSDVGGNSQGAFGLIVNSPLQQDLVPELQQQTNSNDNSTDTSTTSNCEDSNINDDNGNTAGQNSQTATNIATNWNGPEIEWRRGGPVCGGRLGVVHYTILHTYPPMVSNSSGNITTMEDLLDVDIDEEYFEDPELADTVPNNIEPLPTTDNEEEEEEEDDDDDDISNEDGLMEENDDSCAPLSLPVFDVVRNTPPLQFVASPHSSIPSTFSEDSLATTMQQLVRNNTSSAPSGDGLETDSPQSSPEHQGRVIVFSGYCKWRMGQLEREIQREVWDVCVDATPQDILRPHESGFWEEISQGNRLLSWQGLLEEEEGES